MRRFAAIVCLCSLAADWPHVRGPNYDAHSAETGLVDTWPAEGPPVLWSRDLGTGYAGSVVVGERVFTLFQTNGGMFLTALDLDTGAEVWRERVDWPWQPGGMYPGPYASPTLRDGRVYYATPAGTVGCRRMDDGAEVWSLNVRKRFGEGPGTGFGFASTPAVEAGRVFLPVGGPGAAMVALNAANGETLWANGDDPASYSPAYPINFNGRALVVGLLQNTLVLHDAASGERLWRERLSTRYDEHSTWPLFDGRRLLVSSPFNGGAHTFDLSAKDNGIAVKPAWAGPQFSGDVCSGVLADGSVYGFDLHQAQASTHRASRGAFKCLDFATGSVRWETSEVGLSSVLHADGKLILWTETGTLILARATPERYEELDRFRVLGGGGMCWAAPALSGKRLIVRDHKRIVCLYLGPPSELDPNRPQLTLTPDGNGFDWSRLAPREPAFANDAPTVDQVAEWFLWCVGILVVAGIVATLLGRTAGWAVAFLGGLAGTTAIGFWLDRFALTWPLCLYFAYCAVIALGLDRPGQQRRHAVWGRLALAGFLVLSYSYYRLCMAVGYPMAWAYLAGLLPALPLIVLAHRARNRYRRWAWEALAFALYFWVSGLVPQFKEWWGGT